MTQSILPGSDSTPHESAIAHVQGRATYVDDRPAAFREMVIGLVTSPHAHARIKRVDTRPAEKLPGFIRIFSHVDVAHNLWGSIFQDQPFLAVDEVHYVGETILVVAAESPASLRPILQAIHIEYEVLPAVLSLGDAVARQCWIGNERTIERGDWAHELAKAPHRIQGTVRLDGADHFYLENQAAIAYPGDDGSVEVHSSTQHPSEVQHMVAEALGVPFKDVVCQATRLGGAFGGKESQAGPFAVYAALAAHRCGRPARLVLTKDDDMIITGKRNPFEVSYTVGFTDQGDIVALDARLYADGGAYADLSTAIMERAMTHVDNAYYLPTARIRGQVCRTNYHPHTAFRGFGGPKGVALIEHAIEAVAHHRGLDPLEVRLRNCYGPAPRHITPYGQVVEGDKLRPLLLDLAERCDYRSRRQILQQSHDPSSPWGRGISLTPVKFGISFITRFLNQANALVHIHQDGTLQVSTGAVEMGQGIHTRIADMLARELGIHPTNIRVMPTRTDKNANTSATAASSGADMNGAAALIAVRAIKDRLAGMYLALRTVSAELWPSRTTGLGLRADLELPMGGRAAVRFSGSTIQGPAADDPILSFAEVVREAYYNRISLSEYGFYQVPHLDFNKVSGQGRAFLYYTQGAACSEVAVNRLTGETKVVRTDILMDLGRPVNQALDEGQVRGAFVQGLGWMTTEHLVYSPQGLLLSHSPSTYKIPTIQDIPRDFRITLVAGTEHQTMHGGKAVGEPPLLLSFSVWTAIIHAIAQDRSDRSFPSLAIPATRERILRQLDPEAFARWEDGRHE